MMFAREPPLQFGRPGGGAMSPLPPPSPLRYSPTPQDLSTPTTPHLSLDSPMIKSEGGMGGYYSPSPDLKMEPISPQYVVTSYSKGSPAARSSSYMNPQWSQGSPKGLDYLNLNSPMSASGMGCGGGTTGSSPMTMPVSPSSSITLSPGNRLGRDDDFSPSSVYGVNGCNTPAPGGGESRKKKTSSNRQTEEECMVCGDRASGYHYSALTCEGCKGFFRRSITKNNVYTCKYGKGCEMDMYMRRKCQECRFKKCIAVGMRPECVVPETTCQAKREQKKTRDKEKKINDSPLRDPSLQNTVQCVYQVPKPIIKPVSIELNKEQEDLIKTLVWCQSRYEVVDTVTSQKINTMSEQTGKVNKITELTKVTIELIVQYALSIPGFTSLHQDDQVTLLKASSSELTILRASVKYHLDTDSIMFADNAPVTREFYIESKMDPAGVDLLFNFCKSMSKLEVDNAEYALITGILIFSERPSLVDPLRVEKLQCIYVDALHGYVDSKWRPKTGARMAKVLNVLTQLRPLGIMNTAQCEKFMNQNIPLPELIKEIWDINRH